MSRLKKDIEIFFPSDMKVIEVLAALAIVVMGVVGYVVAYSCGVM